MWPVRLIGKVSTSYFINIYYLNVATSIYEKKGEVRG